MKRRSKICCFIALIGALIGNTAVSPAIRVYAQERLDRPPARDLYGTPAVPAGSNAIPVGTVFIIEMDTALSSKTAHPSDRFKAHIATPVVDENAETLIPIGSTIEGRVSAVQPAKWARRSGALSLTFDKIKIGTGPEIPIAGVLTSASASDRKRFDDERNLKSGSTTKRDVFFVGGGAGTGAAIGIIAGSALAGAGIGAAAGMTTILLMKGKDAVIEQGHRFGLELKQPLQLSTLPAAKPNGKTPSSTTLPVRGGAAPTSALSTARVVGGSGGVSVNVSDVRAQRYPDGVVRILVIAETPSTGWRIYTDYGVTGDTVDVRILGVAPTGTQTNQLSHPTAPPIRIEDETNQLRRVTVRAKNGTRNATVTTASGSKYAGGAKTTPATSGGSTAAPAGSSVVGQIEQIRYDYGSTIGVWINQDGTYEVIGQRKPTSDEKQLLDGLGSQLNSVRTYNNSSDPAVKRSNAAKVETDTNAVERSWKRVKMSDDLNKKFRTMITDTRALIASDTGSAPSSTGSTSTQTKPSTKPPSGSTSTSSPQVATVAGEIQQCQYEFGGTVGVWINPDGTYDVLGTQKPSADQKQILDGLTAMYGSVKSLDTTTNTSAQRNTATKIQQQANSIEQAWKRVSMSDSLNQKFAKMLQDARALADNYLR